MTRAPSCCFAWDPRVRVCVCVGGVVSPHPKQRSVARVEKSHQVLKGGPYPRALSGGAWETTGSWGQKCGRSGLHRLPQLPSHRQISSFDVEPVCSFHL